MLASVGLAPTQCISSEVLPEDTFSRTAIRGQDGGGNRLSEIM